MELEGNSRAVDWNRIDQWTLVLGVAALDAHGDECASDVGDDGRQHAGSSARRITLENGYAILHQSAVGDIS